MPKIGNVDVSDDVARTLQAADASRYAPPRPGLGAVLGAAAQGAIGQVRYGLPYQAAKLTGTLTPDQEATYRQGLAQTQAASEAAAPATPGDVLNGKVGVGRFLAENAVASLPYLVGATAGAVGARLGGAEGAGILAGSILGATPQFSGMNVARAVQEQGSLSDQSAARALAVAPFQAGADALIGRVLPGAGHVLGDAAAEVGGSTFLRRTANSVLQTGGTAAVSLAGQQLAQRYAAGLPTTDANAAEEYVSAAATAFALGGVLGAAGGFRRTPATAKPVADVTVQDLGQHVDEVLNGQDQNPQLALPAPPDITVGEDGQARVNPNGTIQQALPAPTTPTDFIVDSEGRAAPATPEGARDIITEQNAPQPSAPGTEELLGRIRDATTPPDIGAPNALAQPGVREFTPPEGVQLPPDATRPYNAEPIEDLHAVGRLKNAPDDIRDLASREIQARYDEANGTRPLTGDFSTRLDEAKQGLRGGWVQKLEADSPTDLVNKVYTRIFDDADTSANVAKLAQRLGLLDEKLEPTSLSNRITAERDATPVAPEAPAAPQAPEPAPVAETPQVPEAPAAPEALPAPPRIELAPEAPPAAVEAAPAAPEAPAAPAPSFTEEWNKLKQDAGIERNAGGSEVLSRTPANLADAENSVMHALSTDSSSAEVSQTEKLARKMGLITDDKAMDITPKGREVFLRTPDGIREISSAARDQGFTEEHASLFDRGVRDEAAGAQEPALNDAGEMAAYQAGKVWSRDFIENGEKTRAGAETPVAREGDRTRLSPDQVRQASINRMIEAADLRGVRDSDVATLRRMARDGATYDEVGRALEQVQKGASLFRESDTRVDTFRPARPERRGATFKETVPREERTPSKAEMRAQSEDAVRAYDVRRQIERGKETGAISAERAAKLHALVDEGKIDQADRLSKLAEGAPTKEPPTPGTIFERGANGEVAGNVDPAFEAAIAGKSFSEVADHMITNAPSDYMRAVMQRVKIAADKLQKAGVEMNVQLASAGDRVPAGLNDPRNMAQHVFTMNPPRSDMWFKSASVGGGQGVNYQIAAHEMLHATTSRLIAWGSQRENAGTKIGKDVANLMDLGRAIMSHFNERFASGQPLDAFEKEVMNHKVNATANAREVLAWGLTNPDMQRYLQGIEYTPKQSVFSKLVDLVGKLFGFDTSKNTALSELLRVSERVLAPDQGELRAAYGLNDPNLGVEGPLTDNLQADGAAATPAAPAVNDATRSLSERLTSAVDKLNPKDFTVKARRTLLSALTHNQIDREYGQTVPGVVAHSDAHRARTALHARVNQLGDTGYHEFAQLERDLPKTAENLGRVMAAATEFQLDPAKTWDEHTWIDKENPESAARLKRVYDEMQKMVRSLHADDGRGWQVFSNLRTLNEMQNVSALAVDLHRLITSDPELVMGIRDSSTNPADAFMARDDLSTPQQVRDFWTDQLNQQVAAATAFVQKTRGEIPTLSRPEQKLARQRLTPLEGKLQAIQEARASMLKAPYFHLGRFGDNFGAAVIRKLADGTVDPVAQRAVADLLEKSGLPSAQISTDNTKPRFMLRLETVDQVARFDALAKDMAAKGLLDPEEKVQSGPRDRSDNYGVSSELPEYVAQYIANLDNSPMYQPEPGMTASDKAALETLKQEAIQIARDTWIERQPDSAISKMMTQRNTVPGYNPDMMRNFAQRWRVGAMSLANKASEPKFNQAFESMRGQYRDELIKGRTDEQGNAIPDGDPYRTQDVMVELKMRDAKNPVNAAADTFDKLRSVAHSYYLGLSPAYNLINLSQLGVTALPELAKKHGFSSSFHAMRRASSDAFNIIKAVASESGKAGWQHWGDVAITNGVLDNAKLSPDLRQFVQHMMATGTIDIGSMARSLGQVANNSSVGGKLETLTRLSSAAGLYTETFSRLVTALAARELHGDFSPEAQSYAAKSVSNAMFDYQSWNTGRAFGRKGILGPVTPIVTQFMSYQMQMVEKLYSEMHDAFGKVRPGESVETAAQRRAESRNFLLGHMAAVTALTGTLGLPFTTVFAGALEKIVNATQDPNDPPFDASAAYRNFLSGVFGKDVGEVVARGLPRALGADISSRAGEQNILPFSEFMTSSRSWKDAVADSAGKSVGAVPSMLVSALDGGAQLAHGDLLGGMKAFMPTAFKGPIEAYRMSDQGYVDSKGNRLPMTPTASSYVWQLLGFTPSQRAEYSEAKTDQFNREQAVEKRSGALHQQILRAIMSGDKEATTSAVQDASEFDAKNPAFAVLPRVGTTIARSQRAAAQAAAMGVPLGVKPKDIAGQRMTRYANLN